MTPEQIAPLVAFLVADSAKEVNGQTFAVRGTEITLFSVPSPERAIHRAGGWTVDALAEQLPETFKRDFAPLVSGSPKPPQSGETRRHRHFAASAARRLTGSLPSNRSQSAGCGLCG